MTKLLPILLPAAALVTALRAQGPDFLITFSQTETTLSGSNGTSLQTLRPNEIAHLEYSNGPCTSLSAEKWAPRAVFHAMAGDENSDGMYWDPAIFGSIDALLVGISPTPIGGTNPRAVFFSPSIPMGAGVSSPDVLRPGDIGHIVRNSSGDGKIEYFLKQEQINQALGLPLSWPIDVDAAAWAPGHGIFLSLDQDVPVMTPCGPMLMQDGAIFMIPDWATTWTTDFRVASTVPNSAFIVYSEASVDAMVQNAQVTNRSGVCLTACGDTEALDIDWQGPWQTIVPCAGAVLQVPSLLFSVENGTGASVLTTAGGGAIYTNLCTTMGTACGSGPTFGPQSGIRPASTTLGAPSYVNALAGTWTMRYAMEARNPVLNSSPSGLPANASLFDINSPAPFNWIFVTLVPSGINAVPTSLPAFPWSMFGFPDYYPMPTPYTITPTIGGTATFGSFPIPPNFPVKILFQSVGIVSGMIELSTPAILDIQ